MCEVVGAHGNLSMKVGRVNGIVWYLISKHTNENIWLKHFGQLGVKTHHEKVLSQQQLTLGSCLKWGTGPSVG
jgi:hypothetical protein